MKHLTNYYRKSSFLILFALFSISSINAFGQEEEKKSVILSVEHQKIIGQYSILKISTKYKIEKAFFPCEKLMLTIYAVTETELEDGESETSEKKIGQIKTNEDGKAKFIIPATSINETKNEYVVKVEDSAEFEDEEESVEVLPASLKVSIEEIDSIKHIKAILTSADGEPLEEQDLKVGLKRLFGNLQIGEDESYSTDEEGVITVPIDAGLTGVDGKLIFQVKLEESDEYGTIIANFEAGFGEPITDKSSFNERTMWSPPTLTPIYLWIFPNILLIGVWSILFVLVINLFKIYKSKN
ncbi:MAG: hypothetical protein K0B10_05305 [Vicingaceae bacterium]|nr:hypothetical protein [Vicingaceae bacterium]